MDTKTDSHATPTRRREDDYLLRGTGRYMADAPLPGQTYACFVRSQHACADIKSIDIKPARFSSPPTSRQPMSAICRSTHRWEAVAAPS
jgi:hypothetical protein